MVKDPAGTLFKAGHGGRVEGSGDNSRPRNASLLPSSLPPPKPLPLFSSHPRRQNWPRQRWLRVCQCQFLWAAPDHNILGLFFYRIQSIQILPVVQQFNERDIYQLACLAFGLFLKWPMDKDTLVVRPCIAYIRSSAARVYSEK